MKAHCTLCMEQFQPGDEIVVDEEGHIYHKDCCEDCVAPVEN